MATELTPHRRTWRLGRALLWFPAVALLASAGAGAASREVVSSLRPLLMQAAASGHAEGVLGGAAAQGLSQAFGSTEPIEIDVARLHALREPGCARLRVVTRQTGIHPTASAPAMAASQAMTYDISFCDRGTFPKATGQTAR